MERTSVSTSVRCRPRQPALWPPPESDAQSALIADGVTMDAAMRTALRASRCRRWCSQATNTTSGAPMNRSSPTRVPSTNTGRESPPSRNRARATTSHNTTAQKSGSESAPWVTIRDAGNMTTDRPARAMNQLRRAGARRSDPATIDHAMAARASTHKSCMARRTPMRTPRVPADNGYARGKSTKGIRPPRSANSTALKLENEGANRVVKG